MASFLCVLLNWVKLCFRPVKIFTIILKLCVTCLNILKMGVGTGAMKSLDTTLLLPEPTCTTEIQKSLSLDKMAAISQTKFSTPFSLIKSFVFWIEFQWQLFLMVINNKSAQVQVMAWCQTGGKPLPEPMLTQFTYAYLRHHGDELRNFILRTICALSVKISHLATMLNPKQKLQMAWTIN